MWLLFEIYLIAFGFLTVVLPLASVILTLLFTLPLALVFLVIVLTEPFLVVLDLVKILLV